MSDFNKPIPKSDAESLLSGKPVYTEDLAPEKALVVKVLRSPHAFAEVIDVNAATALKIEGIEGIYSYKDVPDIRFCNSGQSYPKPSPNDRKILDKWVRYVGDPVAIVAGSNEKVVDKALRLIKVEYKVLEPVLDPEKAMGSDQLVHPEEDWNFQVNVGGSAKRNLIASGEQKQNDVDEVFEHCDIIVEEQYTTKANSQVYMETFRAHTWFDEHNRLCCLSSTQIPFHVRRILGTALGIPMSRVRVIKPRVGGGFGAKQTAVMEFYPAFVTMKTGKAATMIYSRQESMIAGSQRHPMKINVKIGASKDGIIKAIDMYALSDSGAYGEHGSTTIGLTGGKAIPIYGKFEAYRFRYDVVYTNHQAYGAYRGYGATQGIFALESAVDELAHKLGIDPLTIRQMNAVEEGQWLHILDEPNDSCVLSDMLTTAREKIGWDDIYPRKVLDNGHIVAVGSAMAMQGSGIAKIDSSSARVLLEEDGFYTLMIGSTDMGTGSDTTLTQIASEVLQCSTKRINVHGVDTDVSPYDPGSYASSTAYVTGNAVKLAAEELVKKMVDCAASMLDSQPDQIKFDGESFTNDIGVSISLVDLSTKLYVWNHQRLEGEASWGGEYSPPPAMAACVKIDLDPETGKVQILDYVAEVDCGTIINPNLVKVQTEGGLMQGIGMALTEDSPRAADGRTIYNSLLTYQIPRRDLSPNIRVDFNSSYEPSGPFGVKSIGEVVINTPSPAIGNAIYNACGLRLRELPFSSEDIWKGLQEKSESLNNL